MNKDEFFTAIGDGDVARIRLALQDEPGLAELRWESEDGEPWQVGASPLIPAVYSGSMQMVELVLSADVDPSATCEDSGGRRNAAHLAYEHQGVEMCRRLLQAGATCDMNLAAALGDYARVAELLHHDPGLITDATTGLSPLGWAGYGQSAQMIPYLLQRGAPYAGEMCCPAGLGHPGHVQAFLDAGADPNAPMGDSGHRPLHSAAAMPYTESNDDMVRLLVEAGAQVNGRDAEGRTALDIARERLEATREPGRRAGLEGVIAALEKLGGLLGDQLDRAPS